MAGLTSSDLAKSGGVNLESIRFYERQGLLPKPPRTSGGYRQFPAESVQSVRFIKRAQTLGFTLAEIRELLALRIDAGKACHDVESRARATLLDIEQRIRTLKGMKRALSHLVAACSEGGGSDECPILQALEHADARMNLAKVRMKS